MEVVMTTGAIRRAMLQSNRHQQTNIQFFTDRMSFLSPNQQCQSTEGRHENIKRQCYYLYIRIIIVALLLSSFKLILYCIFLPCIGQ